MSLVAFHRLLIAAGIVFCFGFGVWEVRSWMTTGNTNALIIGMGFVLLGAGLAAYLRRLSRFLGIDQDTEPGR